MTFTTYYWTISAIVAGIHLGGWLLAKALWPTLQKHKWVIGEWE